MFQSKVNNTTNSYRVLFVYFLRRFFSIYTSTCIKILNACGDMSVCGKGCTKAGM